MLHTQLLILRHDSVIIRQLPKIFFTALLKREMPKTFCHLRKEHTCCNLVAQEITCLFTEEVKGVLCTYIFKWLIAWKNMHEEKYLTSSEWHTVKLTEENTQKNIRDYYVCSQIQLHKKMCCQTLIHKISQKPWNLYCHLSYARILCGPTNSLKVYKVTDDVGSDFLSL